LRDLKATQVLKDRRARLQQYLALQVRPVLKEYRVLKVIREIKEIPEILVRRVH
jgi:hypothetical protein